LPFIHVREREMIRMEVMGWATFILLAIFAFILMPVHERFVDAGGRQTDVSPDAPPVPEALKPINARTGKKETFVDAQGRYTDVSPNAPPMPAWLNPGGQNRSTIVSPGSVRPMDTSTDYSRTAPPNTILGAPSSSMGSAPVGTGESSTCWDKVDSSAGKFFDTGLLMQSFMNGREKIQVCDPDGSGFISPTDTFKKCLSDAGVGFFSLDQAKASCVSDSSCTAVLENKNPSGGPGNLYRKFYGSTALTVPAAGGPPIPIGTAAYTKKPCAVSSHLQVISSPTAAAPRITSTLGTADPSISGMYSEYTSGVIAPTGSQWAGLQNMGEMAAVPTNPASPILILNSTTPDTGLFGPGPNILRKNLVACRCASQAGSCPVHR
jgi:hypothetical protein